MKLSDLVTGDTIVLDENNAATAWLFDELEGVLPSGAPITLQRQQAAVSNRFIAVAGTVWADQRATVDLFTDDNLFVTGVRIGRPALGGQVQGHKIHSVEDALDINFDGYDTDEPHLRSFIRRFEARLSLTDHRHLTVSLTPIGNEGFTVDAEFKKGEGPSLADLGRLFHLRASGPPPSHDLADLPEELADSTLVELSDLRVTIRHETQDDNAPIALPGARGKIVIDHIHAGLRFFDGHTWPLIPGIKALSVGDLRAELDVDHPLEPDYRFPAVTVMGSIVLDQGGSPAKIELTGRWPDYAVSGRLAEGSIDLGRLIEDLGVPAGDLPDGGLEVSELVLSSDRVEETRSFSLLGEIKSDWPLHIGKVVVKPTDLRFHATYEDGRKPKLQGGFAATIAIDDRAFRVSAEASGGGWQFEGGMAEGSAPLNLGDAIAKIAKHFDDAALPEALSNFAVTGLDISFNTKSRDGTFDIACEDDLGKGSVLTARLRLTCQKQPDGNYAKTLSGHLQIGGRIFDLQVARKGSTTATAVYADAHPESFNIGRLADALGLPSVDFEIDLQAAMVALSSGTSNDLKLVGIDVDGGMDISALPLVGKLLPPGQRLSLALQILYASRDLHQPDGDVVTAINKVLPDAVPRLPDAKDIKKDLHVTPRLDIAGESITLDLPVEVNATKTAVEDRTPRRGGALPSTRGQDTEAKGVKWFPIQKQFGPAHITRIGGSYAKGEVMFLIDGSLSMGPLSFSMDGLSVTSPLKRPDPHFDLRGLGLDFSSGPLEIGGALLRTPIKGGYKYAGAAVIRAKAFSLSAMGSYAEIHGEKSVVLYAVLDYPLGGPAFFFVTGLAAGFGYNRQLLAPDIAEVNHYPLIEEAIGPQKRPVKLDDEIAKLDNVIPISPGDYCMAVGVKFNSFKMIDSFALLAVTFGKHFEVDVIGLSNLVVPTPETKGTATPLALIEMALEASFQPDVGILKVDAALTDASYLLTKNCRLSGGYAFYSCLTGPHAGDFVVSMGGYNPRYNPPAHYPTPPRVGVNWHIDDNVQIKGDVYYALTPHVLMAGGHMEATYHSGAIQAWCKAGADFLIGWTPYHYDASMYVHIGGSLTFHFIGTHHITVDLGADLHIWGPELSGHAHVDLTVTHFDFDFGAGTAQGHVSVGWKSFADKFLPEKGLLTIAVAEGLIETVIEEDPATKEKTEIWIVNPKTFRLFTDGFVPSTGLALGARGAVANAEDRTVPNPAGKGEIAPVGNLGISSMGVQTGKLRSVHRIKLKQTSGVPKKNTFDHFSEPSLRVKQAPTALWGAPPSPSHTKGTPPKPRLSEKGFVGWAMSGIELTPHPVEISGESLEVRKRTLVNGKQETVASANWAPIAAADFNDHPQMGQRRNLMTSEIMSAKGTQRRDELLAAFGLSEMVPVMPFRLANDFIEPPHRVGPPIAAHS